MKSNMMWVALSMALLAVFVCMVFVGSEDPKKVILTPMSPMQVDQKPQPLDEWEVKKKELEETIFKLELRIKEKEAAVAHADYAIEIYGKMVKKAQDPENPQPQQAEQFYEELLKVQANRQKDLKEWEEYQSLLKEWRVLETKFRINAKLRGK